MSNKITDETKNAVRDMFKQGKTKTAIAKKCGISVRSVGRIVGGTIPNPDAKGYVVRQEVRSLMEYVRREIKGVEALTYLLESNDTPNNLECYRETLVKKLYNIKWWVHDVQGIELGIHEIRADELKAIHKGDFGIK